MTIHKGRVNGRQLATLLHSILIGEGYTEISSEVSVDGRVYKSPSTKGEDLFFIQLKDPQAYFLTVGIYESYTPNDINGLPGVFLNGLAGMNSIMWTTGAQSGLTDLDYVINATGKRVIVYVSGLQANTAKASSLTYIGLPKRISKDDKSGTFAGLAVTGQGISSMGPNQFISLRNRANATSAVYIMDYYRPRRSYGWGKKLFFSTVYIGDSYEGTRGILDGIMFITSLDKNYEISVGDTFTHEGKNYMYISPPSIGGGRNLPTGYDYLIEI